MRVASINIDPRDAAVSHGVSRESATAAGACSASTALRARGDLNERSASGAPDALRRRLEPDERGSP
jgi:hypothetical protein